VDDEDHRRVHALLRLRAAEDGVMKIYDNEEVLSAVFMLLKRNWTLASSKKPKEEWEAHFGPIVLNLDFFREANHTVYDLRSTGWLVKFYVYRTSQHATIKIDGFFVGPVCLREGDPELFERDLFILMMATV
jgi:hypothetical protein